jgi:hypothetical protein
MAAGDLKGLIDKDDPRSRLHFVKYLKRGGKTLKIWECGICMHKFVPRSPFLKLNFQVRRSSDTNTP